LAGGEQIHLVNLAGLDDSGRNVRRKVVAHKNLFAANFLGSTISKNQFSNWTMSNQPLFNVD
jgi:hypothetical protein